MNRIFEGEDLSVWGTSLIKWVASSKTKFEVSVEYLTNFRPRVRVILRMDEKRKKRKKRTEKRYNRKRSWRLITPDPVVKNLYEKIPMRVGWKIMKIHFRGGQGTGQWKSRTMRLVAEKWPRKESLVRGHLPDRKFTRASKTTAFSLSRYFVPLRLVAPRYASPLLTRVHDVAHFYG